MKELNNYEKGALKRKLGVKNGDSWEPGELIQKSKAVSQEKLSIMGLT